VNGFAAKCSSITKVMSDGRIILCSGTLFFIYAIYLFFSYLNKSRLDLKHDNSHIHRASPIRGLPPEEKTPQNTLEGKAQGDIKISGSNQARWVKPTTYGGPVLQERGAEPAIPQESTKHDDGYHQLLAPTCGLQPSIMDKTGI